MSPSLLIALFSLLAFLEIGPRVPNKALRELIDRANAGDLETQLDLANRYWYGLGGVQADSKMSLKFSKMAADQGHNESQFYVGNMMFYGSGDGEVNKVLGCEYYEKSSIQGNSDAQHMLGYCYDNGEGVEKDGLKAYAWYYASAIQDHKCAQTHLADMYYYGSVVDQDLHLAAMWAIMGGNKEILDALKLELSSQQLQSASNSAYSLLRDIRLRRILD